MNKFSTGTFLFLLTSCGRPLVLKGVKATETRVEATVTTTTSGTIEAEQQAILSFTTTGRVARINVKVGAEVKKNQILAELDNNDLKTIRDDAERESKRGDELFKEGLISRAGLDESKKAFEIARSNYERSVIRAPFDGMISDLNLQIGELSQSAPTTKAPMQIMDLKPRIIKGEIDEADLGKVKVGSPARVKILAMRRKEPFEAEVTQVVPFVGTTREQDRTSRIELRFKNVTELIPVGASADVEIIVNSKEGVTALPTRAVVGSGSKRSVFVWDGARLQKREVQLGLGNYDRTEIVSGIKSGETVALPGEDIELVDGMKAKVDTSPWP